MDATMMIKTPEQIIARLDEFGREILATFADTGDKRIDETVDTLLGTLFACCDETSRELERIVA